VVRFLNWVRLVIFVFLKKGRLATGQEGCNAVQLGTATRRPSHLVPSVTVDDRHRPMIGTKDPYSLKQKETKDTKEKQKLKLE
jgi:hypothetical protein